MKAISTALIAFALGCVVHGPAAQAQTETVLYSFANSADGANPLGGVIDVNGMLYGTTYYGGTGSCNSGGCGTVFSLNPQTGAETVLYSFGSDGGRPQAGLLNADGTLYGTTLFGGAHDGGAVFSFNPATDAESVLYSFCSQKKCKDGSAPRDALISVGGTLYGTTSDGGTHNVGTVFSVNPTTGAETVLRSFDSRDGAYPQAALFDLNGTLYGTTVQGGTYGNGTAFSLKGSKEKVLYSFGDDYDGDLPYADLISVNGALYGTTAVGGSAVTYCSPDACGVVFSLDTKTGAETVVYSFCSQANCSDGAAPYADLIDVDGTLYGTTEYGGAGTCNTSYEPPGCGTVFSLNLETGAETVVYSFQNNGADGANPAAGLIEVNGTLYGTTENGGAYGYGTVFSITP
jgi:uncharacterized repeat protein (TIGR03803 family)